MTTKAELVFVAMGTQTFGGLARFCVTNFNGKMSCGLKRVRQNASRHLAELLGVLLRTPASLFSFRLLKNVPLA